MPRLVRKTTPPLRWRLKTHFVVVPIVAAHFAFARADPIFATQIAACTTSLFAIRTSRQAFQFSRPATSTIDIVTAMLVSSTFLTVLSLTHTLAPVPSKTTWFYGDGFQALIFGAFAGASFGFMLSLPVVLVYGAACFVRQLRVKRPGAGCRTLRRSKWHLAFTLLLVAYSATMAIVKYPYLPCFIAALMGAVACSGIILRVGWFVPCTVAGANAGLIFGETFRGGSIESQMLLIVTSISVGAIIGCVLGVAIDFAQRSERVD